MVAVEAETKQEAEAAVEALLKDHIVVLEIDGVADETNKPTQ
jgi:hypothetical protein